MTMTFVTPSPASTDDPRSVRGIAFVFLLGLVLFSSPAAAQPPVVFKVSEGVRPNAIVSLYGEFLADTPSVRFLKADGTVAATESSVQTDRGGHFCRVVFPAIAPGAYRLAVSNAAGWSTQAIYVNRADPRWISEERAYPGLPMKLLGRNLDAAEYHGTRHTQVRFVPVDGGIHVALEVQAVNPYCVDLSVPADVTAGKYYVEVSTQSAEYGRDWVRLDNHSEFPDQVRDTMVQVESAPTDPMALALKVAWANDFNWGHVVDAQREFQAQGDGSADDTQAIQKALDHVGQSGGGVVLLPNGVYKVSSLVLPGKCILQGESREGTVVMVSKIGDDGAITTKGSAHGIASMTLKYQPNVPASRQGMLLAGAANQLFLCNTKFDLLRNPDTSVKQGPYYVSGNGPMLVADCQFFISSRNLWNHQVKNRVTFRDNFIDMHDGLGLCMSSEKLLVLHNELVFHPASYAGQMNGFFLNEGWVGWNIYNAYIADNNAHDLNGPGDCQPYAADSAWSCFAGAVTGSTANTVDVRADVRGDFKGLAAHEMELLVVQGKGLGQIRRMSAPQNQGGSPPIVRCAVSPPWDVPPDTTSVITAGSWHVNNVFFGNTARGSKSPYNMYFGGCYDCVDAQAVSENTEGWNNWGRIGEFPDGNAWHCPVYFNQLKRSTFTGLAPQHATMGITLRVENETKNYRGIGDYGTEIRDNTIDRAACANKDQRLAGNAAIGTFNQSWMKVTTETPLLLATLCEGNTIKNSSVGFDLNGSFSFAIRGTTYENCPQAVNDRGHDTALLPGAPAPLNPAVPTAGLKYISDPAHPKLTKALGDYGGIASGTPGQVTPTKFWGIRGIGMDAQDNVYVALSEMGTVLRKFTPAGKLVWELCGHFFVDVACADPLTDGQDVWAVQEHYDMDYTQPAAKQAKWVGYSLDRHKYPNDPRGLMFVKQQGEHGLTSPQIVYLQGKRFMFVGGMFASNFINIFRFDRDGQGEIAIPSGLIMQWGNQLYNTDQQWPPHRPEGKTFIWRDTNADGDYQVDEYAPNTDRVKPGPFYIDKRGNIWMAYGFFRYDFQGLDENGNPIYSADKITVMEMPKGMKNVARVCYDSDSDTLVAAEEGVEEHGRPDMRHLGRIFVCRNYLAGNRDAISFSSGAGREASCLATAGDYVFTGGWKERGRVHVNRLTDGAAVGVLDPGAAVGGVEKTGWVDILTGITAHRQRDGTYLVFVEEDYRAKSILYRWKP